MGAVEAELRRVARLLAAAYRDSEQDYSEFLLKPGELDPLDTLIQTILSQATADVNSRRAFQRLKARYPTWEAVLAAPLKGLEEAIKPGGLAPQKAPRIKALLVGIRERTGSLDLSFLRGLDQDQAYQFLLGFPGVGPKTAACVLAFSCGRPVFPVDTHIARICRRLGLVAATARAAAIQERLAGLVPPELALSLHFNLIRHGRRVCRARQPLCGQCMLSAGCAHYRNPTGGAV